MLIVTRHLPNVYATGIGPIGLYKDTCIAFENVTRYESSLRSLHAGSKLGRFICIVCDDSVELAWPDPPIANFVLRV